MAAPASPVRGVLADKTTNASLQRLTLDHQYKEARELLPPHSPSQRDETAFLKAPRSLSTWKQGQKRSIHEVNGTYEQELKEQPTVGSSTPASHTATEPNSESDGQEATPSLELKTPISTQLTSFHASLEPPMPLEEHFDIQEEYSQRTLDRIVSAATHCGNNACPAS